MKDAHYFSVEGSPLPVSKNSGSDLFSYFYRDQSQVDKARAKTPFIVDVREDLLKRILPVLDGFQRILKLADEQNAAQQDEVLANWLASMRGTYRNLGKVLLREGLEEIPTVGEKVDFDLHTVIEKRETDEVAPGVIVETLEPGYCLRDKIIRDAKVVVAAKPGSKTSG